MACGRVGEVWADVSLLLVLAGVAVLESDNFSFRWFTFIIYCYCKAFIACLTY